MQVLIIFLQLYFVIFVERWCIILLKLVYNKKEAMRYEVGDGSGFNGARYGW